MEITVSWIFNIIATLAMSVIGWSLKLSYDKGVTAAAEKIKEQLRAELEGHPELIKQMCEIAEKAKCDLRRERK